MTFGSSVGLLVAALAVSSSIGPREEAPQAPDRADAVGEWTMLVDFDNLPLWVATSDLPTSRVPRRTPTAHVLTLLLPAKDGSGERGWILALRRFDCRRGRTRVLASSAGSKAGAPPAIPDWERPTRAFVDMPPHTPQGTAFHAVCDGPGGKDRPRVSGGPGVVYDYQAKLRKDALGF